MGSLFNFYLNHEIILLTERHGEDINTNMNTIFGLSYLVTGISQIIMGFFSSLNQNSIFLVYLAVCVIGMSSIACRLFLQWNQNEIEM